MAIFNNRKTEPYDPEVMNRAIKDIKDGKMGYKKAAKLYGLKGETTRDQYSKMRASCSCVLTEEEEYELCECLKLMARWGFGLTREETIDVVPQYISDLERRTPFKAGRP